MSNEIIPKQPGALADPSQPSVRQEAEKIYNIDRIGEFHAHTSQIVFSSGLPGKRGSKPSSVTYSKDFYNLIVYGNYPWFEETDHITLTKNVVLVEDDNMDPELKAHFSPLTEEIVEELKSFLCILAYENPHGARTTDDHQAMVGQLLDVKKRSNGIEIYYHPLFYVEQQPLNLLTRELGIRGNRGLNELGHSHWSIKAIDLIEVLRDSSLLPF